jgi:hypothetical protein
MTDLASLRAERNRLEKLIDALHRRHDEAQRTARHAVNAVTQAEGDLQELKLRIDRLKP